MTTRIVDFDLGRVEKLGGLAKNADLSKYIL